MRYLIKFLNQTYYSNFYCVQQLKTRKWRPEWPSGASVLLSVSTIVFNKNIKFRDSMSYFQRIRSRYFLVFGHTRILLMSRKYSGLHKMHSQDGEWHVHGEEMRRRAFARGNYERKFTDLWQILRQHSIQVDFRAPLFRVRSSLLPEKRRLNTWTTDHVCDTVL